MSASEDDAPERDDPVGKASGGGRNRPDHEGKPEQEEDEHDRWDENDPRRAKDQMAPPTELCRCYCLHCHREFNSDEIWFQRVVGDPDGFDGFWRCPTPNCDGAGFTFDIFPTDPAHPANAGWTWSDDDEGEWDDDDDDDDDDEEEAEGEAESGWDPDESKWKALDEELGEEDDDIEGEEWKHGLEPGQQLPDPPWVEEARRRWEEEQKRYDGPDERPRELDWSDQPSRRRPPGEGTGEITEDDIPF